MSARDWQPGEEALVRMRDDLLRLLAVGDSQNLDGFDLDHTAEIMYGGQANALLNAGWRPAADLLPVPQADEDTIERLAASMYERKRAQVGRGVNWTPWGETTERIRDLWLSGAKKALEEVAAANLLASPVQPRRSEAEEALARVTALQPFSEQDEDDGGFTRPTITFLREEWDEAIRRG